MDNPSDYSSSGSPGNASSFGGTESFDNTQRGTSGYGSGNAGASQTGAQGGAYSGSGSYGDSARASESTAGDVAHKAQDAVGQLQEKATELTSRLVDSINVDDLTRNLERQVKEHPARTLLLAVGIGFFLGKATK